MVPLIANTGNCSSLCHRTEGTGGLENASLAGLPAPTLFSRWPLQMRRSEIFRPAEKPSLLMTAIAKAATTTPRDTCHGPDLRGVDAVPEIAGRSPSYLVRQIYDFQQHTSEGSAGTPMAPVVEKLSLDDMISLAAYISS
jgi:hypothetical protein